MKKLLLSKKQIDTYGSTTVLISCTVRGIFDPVFCVYLPIMVNFIIYHIQFFYRDLKQIICCLFSCEEIFILLLLCYVRTVYSKIATQRSCTVMQNNIC